MSNPADWTPGQTTGAQLAQALEDHAAATGTTVTKLAPHMRMVEIARAASPRAHTIAAVAAIIRGEAPPPRRHYQRQLPTARARANPAPLIFTEASTPHERGPCFHCGTRGDIGCKHRRPGA